VTSNNVSDAAALPGLLQQLPADEVLESLTGDGAYDTQPVHEVVIEYGAIPIIPPRKNARIRKGSVVVHCSRMHTAGTKYLEALERLSPAKFGGNQDELHQETGRASDVSYL